MATLTVIEEPLPGDDAATHRDAARALAEALGAAAPRGCSARLLVAADREAPEFPTARARTEAVPLKSALMPVLWRVGVAARPLDGEFVHALTPLVPLRSRGTDYDGSQTSVTVPHALAWQAPEVMGAAAARQFRAFVKRAARHADVLVAPTHATAAVLRERFGDGPSVQVVPLAPPPAYLSPLHGAARRGALGLPERYLATVASPGEIGRLDWLFDALDRDPELPVLVVIENGTPQHAAGTAGGEGPAPGAVPERLRDRVLRVQPGEPADIGAIISGAEILASPQALIGAGYEILAALAAGVPVLFAADCAASAELVLDGGRGADREGFTAELGRLHRDEDARTCLGVLAEDRGRSFSWYSTAAQLWELHANI